MLRNIYAIGDIEEGSLWQLQNDLIVLVDDDEFRSLPAKQWMHCFEEAC